MTIVVSWVSREREFSTLWVVADSRLSKSSPIEEIKPLLDCGSKIFSLRVACVGPNAKGYFLDDVYFSTTIGMAFAGSSLIALNLYAFVSYTLGSMASVDNVIPSIDEVANHVNAAFKSLLENFINTNFTSIPCEVSIFGYCPVMKKHRLFHIKHEAKGYEVQFGEFELLDHNSIHMMGNHKDEIRKKILADRRKLIGSKYWRSPKATIEQVIEEQQYPDIGGQLQLGISYPAGFRLTPIYHRRQSFGDKCGASLLYQGVDLYSNLMLKNIGGCFVNIDSIPSG
jgi:hypothetical protein